MKVGILSLPRVINWGSFLQAFALRKTVEAHGHECHFLEIKKNVGVGPPLQLEKDEISIHNLFGKMKKIPHIFFRSTKNEPLYPLTEILT